MHLVVDGYGADPEKLKDPDVVYRFLDRYPEAIGMTKVIPPQVYTYHGQEPADWGVSGFVIIAESHISVHTFPERGYINVDIFSCREFETGPAVEAVKETFGIGQARVWTLERGLEYATPRQAYHGMVRERLHLAATPDRGDD